MVGCFCVFVRQEKKPLRGKVTTPPPLRKTRVKSENTILVMFAHPWNGILLCIRSLTLLLTYQVSIFQTCNDSTWHFETQDSTWVTYSKWLDSNSHDSILNLSDSNHIKMTRKKNSDSKNIFSSDSIVFNAVGWSGVLRPLSHILWTQVNYLVALRYYLVLTRYTLLGFRQGNPTWYMVPSMLTIKLIFARESKSKVSFECRKAGSEHGLKNQVHIKRRARDLKPATSLVQGEGSTPAPTQDTISLRSHKLTLLFPHGSSCSHKLHVLSSGHDLLSRAHKLTILFPRTLFPDHDLISNNKASKSII